MNGKLTSAENPIRIERGGDRSIDILDVAEGARLSLQTGTDSALGTTNADSFPAPIEAGVTTVDTQIAIPNKSVVWVRKPDGTQVHKFSPTNEAYSVPQGKHLLEFSNLPVKLYVVVPGDTLELRWENGMVNLQFQAEAEIGIGARSFHDKPAYEMTITSSPTDLMDAISRFGSAMQTWTPERSYPTLRRYPPLITVGEELSIPDGLEPPETGVKITVPKSREFVFPTAPLAYWLGATVECGPPAIHIQNSRYLLGKSGRSQFESDLGAFQSELTDLLRYTFYMECAIRSWYGADGQFARLVDEGDIPTNCSALRELSFLSRTKRYLDLYRSHPNEMAQIFDEADWYKRADIVPEPHRASVLPTLANDLATIHCHPQEKENEPPEIRDKESIQRGRRSGHSDPPVTDSSGSEASTDLGSNDSILGTRATAPESDSFFQTWVGGGAVSNASKTVSDACRRRIGRTLPEDTTIDIDVVVTSEGMLDESTVSTIYNFQDDIQSNISVYKNLSRDELATVLEQESDYLHYVGHVIEDRLECADGPLSVDSISGLGADLFFLNGCSSYQSGVQLLDKSAVAGVVTLDMISNRIATFAGRQVASLLSFGSSLEAAVKVVHDRLLPTRQYLVVGDARAKVLPSLRGTIDIVRVEHTGEEFKITSLSYPNHSHDVGARAYNFIGGENNIVPCTFGPFKISAQRMKEYLEEEMPLLVVESELITPEQTSVKELEERLTSSSNQGPANTGLGDY